MSSERPECCGGSHAEPDSGLQHCHGTVIHHLRRRSECTEVDCETPEAVHAFAVDCETTGCACAEEVAPAAARGA